MVNCDTFHDYIINCSDGLKVNANLTSATSYKWVITDKFGKEYSNTAIADSDGSITIPDTDVPEGLFTQYSGDFTLQLFEANNECKIVNFAMAKYYEAVCFNVKPGGVYTIKNNLGCEL